MIRRSVVAVANWTFQTALEEAALRIEHKLSSTSRSRQLGKKIVVSPQPAVPKSNPTTTTMSDSKSHKERSSSSSSSQHDQEVNHRHAKNLQTPFVPVRDLRPLPGDLIEFNREMYSHWGLYVGDNQVIHVRGGQPHSEVSFTGRANVKIDDLAFVAGGSRVRINNQEGRAGAQGLDPLPVEQLVSQARQLVGSQVDYDLFKKNCEHYVTEWRYGKPWSDQVDNGLKELRNIAVDARREHLPQMMDALQNYMKSRREDVSAILHNGQEHLRNGLYTLISHADHYIPTQEWNPALINAVNQISNRVPEWLSTGRNLLEQARTNRNHHAEPSESDQKDHDNKQNQNENHSD